MLKLFLKSIIIGIANIIPGVSGGTLAVILNIYDELVEKIGNFLQVDFKTKIEYAKYLAVVGAGAGIGILLFANIIKISVTNYPRATSIVFSLLVLPSIPFIIKGLDYKKFKNIFSFFMGVAVMLIFVYFSLKYAKVSNPELVYGITENTNFEKMYLFKLFICGLIAAGAMIIPGISGSLLLLMLGEYYNIVAFISDFSIKPLIFVGLGVGIGIILFSKIIDYLLKNYREVSLFFITGIVTMSVIQIWVNI